MAFKGTKEVRKMAKEYKVRCHFTDEARYQDNIFYVVANNTDEIAANVAPFVLDEVISCRKASEED